VLLVRVSHTTIKEKAKEHRKDETEKSKFERVDDHNWLVTNSPVNKGRRCELLRESSVKRLKAQVLKIESSEPKMERPSKAKTQPRSSEESKPRKKKSTSTIRGLIKRKGKFDVDDPTPALTEKKARTLSKSTNSQSSMKKISPAIPSIQSLSSLPPQSENKRLKRVKSGSFLLDLRGKEIQSACIEDGLKTNRNRNRNLHYGSSFSLLSSSSLDEKLSERTDISQLGDITSKARQNMEFAKKMVAQATRAMAEGKSSKAMSLFEQAEVCYMIAGECEVDGVKLLQSSVYKMMLCKFFLSWAEVLIRAGKKAKPGTAETKNFMEHARHCQNQEFLLSEVADEYYQLVYDKLLSSEKYVLSSYSLYLHGKALVLQGDLRLGVVAEYYSEACDYFESAAKTIAGSAVHRNWGLTLLTRAKLRPAVEGEREDLHQKSTEQIKKAMTLNPDSIANKHAWATVLCFTAKEKMPKFLQETDVVRKTERLEEVRSLLNAAINIKCDHLESLEEYSKDAAIFCEFLPKDKAPQLQRESKEAQKQIEWISLQKAIYPESYSQVIKFGFLTKQGGTNHGWKRRFFVLNSDALNYYLQPDGKLKGSVPLADVSDIYYNPNEEDALKDRQYRFHLQTDKRTFNIFADAKETRTSWVSVLLSVTKNSL